MEYDSTFLIRNQDQITSKLAILRKNKCLLKVSFGEEHDTFITTILDVNRDEQNITFCYGPPKSLAEKLYHSEAISFETEHNGIKVAFSSPKMLQKRQKGMNVYTSPLPVSLFWQEARDYHRVRVPLSKPSFCEVHFIDHEPVKLRLCDISLTGFSILNDYSEISKLIDLNMLFKGSKLYLFGGIEETISFEVRHRFVVQQGHVTRSEKIGCKFVDASATLENIVQAFMLQLEREYRQSIVADSDNFSLSSSATESA